MTNAIVLGSFDGVHLGHRAVIDAAEGYNCIAVTFSLPPKSYKSSAPKLLMTLEDKKAQLKKCGANEIYVMDFESVKDTSPEDFLNFLKEKFNPYLIVCGFNYRFGKGASGNTETIKAFCSKNGIEFTEIPEVEKEGVTVSSSYIRSLIADGDVKKANTLLSQDFGFSAEVINGDHRGRTIGFPTINQVYPAALINPKFGVYESTVFFDGKTYKAITNLGVRPTYLNENVTCESYIRGFSGDLYGKTVTLRLKRFLRAERKFSSVEELKKAIESDILSL